MINHNNLRHNIAQLAAQRSIAVPSIDAVIPVPQKDRTAFLTNFLVTCIVLVTCITCVAYFAKHNRGLKLFNREPATQYMTQSDGTNLLSSVDDRVSGIESAQKKLQKKIWWLGIASNENATVTSEALKRTNPNDKSNFIYFEKDWKFSRMPNMNFDGEDAKQIRDNVNVK